MLLYHYTTSGFLPRIDENGLQPHVPDPEYLTQGQPVVWLTTELEQPAWLLLNPATGDPVCIQVTLDPNSKRLAHYATWFQKKSLFSSTGEVFTGEDLLKYLSPGQLAAWYVYFGNVRRNRLVLPDYTIVD